MAGRTRIRVARIVLAVLAASLCVTTPFFGFLALSPPDHGLEFRAAALRGVAASLAAGLGGPGAPPAFAFLEVPPMCAEDKRAIFRMGLGLILVWIALGGTLMWLVRKRFVALMARVKIHWAVKFVLLCIAMALLEEAVTTSLTNLGPSFGAVTDAAHCTASKNYFKVVCTNSVIIFVPQFMCWAFLLWFLDFAPVEVMLLYGLTGWIMEGLHSGPGNWLAVGMWTYVYGLMVWLPACTVPADRRTWRASAGRTLWPVRWWVWPLGTLSGLSLAILFAIPMIPLILFFNWLLADVP